MGQHDTRRATRSWQKGSRKKTIIMSSTWYESLLHDPLTLLLHIPCKSGGVCTLTNTLTVAEVCGLLLAAVALRFWRRLPIAVLATSVLALFTLRLAADLAREAGTDQSLSAALAPLHSTHHNGSAARTLRSITLAAKIAWLFQKHGCQHAYIDIGTNKGMQIRKLYEPSRYASSNVLPNFDAAFGPSAAQRCGVCTIGVEPNPMHFARLRELEHRLRAVGAPVLVLHAAAGVENGVLDFGAQRADLAFSAVSTPRGSETRTRVPQYDLAALIRLVDEQLRLLTDRQRVGRGRGEHPTPQRAAASTILMKLDVEGHERVLWPHLRRTGAACLLNVVYSEWHEKNVHLALQPAERGAIAAIHRGTNARFGWVRPVLAPWRVLASLGESPAGCRLRVLNVDDELGSINEPWPTGPLCARRHAVNGNRRSP